VIGLGRRGGARRLVGACGGGRRRRGAAELGVNADVQVDEDDNEDD
jgi:hypothetical protein